MNMTRTPHLNGWLVLRFVRAFCIMFRWCFCKLSLNGSLNIFQEIMKHQKHLELSVAQINHINRKVRELTTSHRALDASGIDTIDLNSNPLLSLSESSVSTLRSVGTDFGFMEGRSSLPDFMLDPGEEPSIQTKGQPLKPPKLVNPSKTTTTSKNPPEQESLLSKFPKLATML